MQMNPVDHREAMPSQRLLSCQIAPSKFTIHYSQKCHSSKVKCNSISRRRIYTRAKVYRSVMLGAAGFRRRYFGYTMQGWKVHFRSFQWICGTARFEWDKTFWTMKFQCLCTTKAYLICVLKLGG